MKKDTKVESGLTVGVDLGDRWSRYCVLDQQGQILEEDTIATTGQAFRKLFGERSAARVVIEVGTHSPWVQRLVLAVNACRRSSLQAEVRGAQSFDVVNVVQERRELLPPIPLGDLTYSLERAWRACPALSPERVALRRVPLGRPPSLHRLRRPVARRCSAASQVVWSRPTSHVRSSPACVLGLPGAAGGPS